MNTKKTKNMLEHQIIECKKRLKELSLDIETDEQKSKEYNKIIVQKALLIDDYKRLCYKSSISQRLKVAASRMNPFRKFKKKQKLICDYFLS